jgi:SnoaL-like domain
VDAKEVFRQFTAAVDANDISALAALVHDDFRIEGAGVSGIGKREFVAVMKSQLDAIPDYSENPSDISEDDGGDVVRFIAHVSGTQDHPLVLPGQKPIPATGRHFQLPPEPAWIKVKDGKLLVYHVEAVPGGGVEGIISQLQRGQRAS